MRDTKKIKPDSLGWINHKNGYEYKPGKGCVFNEGSDRGGGWRACPVWSVRGDSRVFQSRENAIAWLELWNVPGVGIGVSDAMAAKQIEASDAEVRMSSNPTDAGGPCKTMFGGREKK